MLYDWLYVVYSSDYSFLNIMSAKLLNMIFILLTGYKFGFCGMIFKWGTLQKSGREVLKEGIFKKYKYYFPYKLCHSLRFIISRFIVLNLFPRSRQFVDLASCQIQYRYSCHSCSTLSHLSVCFIGLIYL